MVYHVEDSVSNWGSRVLVRGLEIETWIGGRRKSHLAAGVQGMGGAFVVDGLLRHEGGRATSFKAFVSSKP